jgi:outer membrane lipoprotein-sorting protein
MTAEQIVAAYTKAVGGPKSFEMSKCYQLSVSMETEGRTMQVRFTVKNGKLLIVAKVPDYGLFRFGYDGKTAWQEDPESGLHKVKKSDVPTFLLGGSGTPSASGSLVPLGLDPKSFKSLVLKGVEKVDGRESYAVKIVPNKSGTETVYIDCRTFYLLREVEEDRKGKTTSVTDYSDYREVAGIKLPFVIAQTSGGTQQTTTINECAMSADVDDAVFAYPQPPKWMNADEVIAAYIKAIGGDKVYEPVRTYAYRVTWEFPDDRMKNTSEYYRDGLKYRTTSVDEKGVTSSGCDGKTEWSLDPKDGLTTKDLAGRPASLDGKPIVCGPHDFLLDLKAKRFTSVETRGIENVGDVPAYAVVMKPAAGDTFVRYFDCRTSLLVRMDQLDAKSALIASTDFSDFKRVAGILLPFKSSSHGQGSTTVTTFSSIEINEPLDPAVFAVPAPQHMATADQVIAGYVKAIGGEKAYEPVKTLMREQVSEDGKTHNVEYQQAGCYQTTLTTADGQRYTYGSDGKTYWNDDPVNGVSSSPMTASQAVGFVPIFGPQEFLAAMRSGNRYSSVYVRGIEEVDGKPAYALRFDNKNGTYEIRFFDCSTSMLLRYDYVDRRNRFPMITRYSDYRPVAGVLVPFESSTDCKGLVTKWRTTTLKVNEPIDPTIFQCPKKGS